MLVEEREIPIEDDELSHYGILGMKWGIRRYQPYPKGDGRKGKFIGKTKQVASSVKRGTVKAARTIGKVTKSTAKVSYLTGKKAVALAKDLNAKKKQHDEAKAIARDEKLKADAAKEYMKKHYAADRKIALTTHNPNEFARTMHTLSDAEFQERNTRLTKEAIFRQKYTTPTRKAQMKDFIAKNLGNVVQKTADKAIERYLPLGQEKLFDHLDAALGVNTKKDDENKDDKKKNTNQVEGQMELPLSYDTEGKTYDPTENFSRRDKRRIAKAEADAMVAEARKRQSESIRSSYPSAPSQPVYTRPAYTTSPSASSQPVYTSSPSAPSKSRPSRSERRQAAREAKAYNQGYAQALAVDVTGLTAGNKGVRKKATQGEKQAFTRGANAYYKENFTQRDARTLGSVMAGRAMVGGTIRTPKGMSKAQQDAYNEEAMKTYKLMKQMYPNL